MRVQHNMGTSAPPTTTTIMSSAVGQQVRLLEPRPFRPFKTSEEYLYAMKEDLAEWLHGLYQVDISVDNFMEELETGVVLCQHANRVHKLALDEGQGHLVGQVVYRHTVAPGTFPARDNVSNFIKWCRQLGIYECLLFETEDLVTRKNEKSFILCLLEVARRGAKWGMPAPLLVQMEQEIDRDIARDNANANADETTTNMVHEAPDVQDGDRPQIIRNDLKSLDEMVRDLVNRCVCPEQFLMVREAEGKYRIGDTKMLIYVRILRSHVMVRVGGGWDTLEHFLDKHDPCRCRQVHRPITSSKLTIKHGQNGAGQTHMQVTYERSPLAMGGQTRHQSLSPMSGSPPRMRKASSSSNSSNQPSSCGSQSSLNAEKVTTSDDTLTSPSRTMSTPTELDSSTNQHQQQHPRLRVITPPEDNKDLSPISITNGHKSARGTKPVGSPRNENGRRTDRSPRRCKVPCLDCSPGGGVPCHCNGNTNNQLQVNSKKSLVSNPGRSPSMDNLCRQQHNQSASPSMSRRNRRLSHDHYNNPSSLSAGTTAVTTASLPTRPRATFNRSLSSGHEELCNLTRDSVGRSSARERRTSPAPSVTGGPFGRSTWNSSSSTRSRPSLRPDTFRPPKSHSRSYNSSPTKVYRDNAQMLEEILREQKLDNLDKESMAEMVRFYKEKLNAQIRQLEPGYLKRSVPSRTYVQPASPKSPHRSINTTNAKCSSGVPSVVDEGECYTKQWLANNSSGSSTTNGQRKRRSSLASPSSPDSGSDLGCELPRAASGSGSGCDEPDGQGEGSNMSSESSSSVVVKVSPRKDLQQAAAASKIPVPVFH